MSKPRFLSEAQAAVIEQASSLLDGLAPALRFVIILIGDAPVPTDEGERASLLCATSNITEDEVPLVLQAYLRKYEQDAKMERDS